MAETYSAGRILLLPKGTFATATAYSAMDYVAYEGSTYVCKADVAADNTLTPDNDTDHWQLMARGTDTTALDALQKQVDGIQTEIDNEWEVVSTWT